MNYRFLCRAGKIGRLIFHKLRRRALRNTRVTIISNNCWGGFMYQYYNLPFNSPFIGLFMMADDYLRLLENRECIYTPLRFITHEQSRYHDVIDNTTDYPIGLIDNDIEIHFLHFKSPAEAAQKWERRIKRIDWDNAIVKFSQTDDCTPDHIRRFERLPYGRKVCFTARPFPDCPSAISLGQGGATSVKSCWKRCEAVWDFVDNANALLSK